MLNALNKAQAEAVYSAMVALNNVGARAHVRIELDNRAFFHIAEHEGGEIQVFVGDAIGNRAGGSFEQYANQAEFAKAYELN